MSRASLLQQEMGLGPAWMARGGWFEQHPAQRPREQTQADDAESGMPEAIAPPDPALEPRSLIPAPQETASVAPPASNLSPPEQPQPAAEPLRAEVATESPLLDWPQLQRKVSDCQDCRLCETRTQTVFGRGNPQARWMLIGEAPGENEDRQGLPFVGRAGQLLDNMLSAAGLDREQDVYIANVLKCRPPGNRNPAPDEIAACNGYLLQQIRHIQPTLIVALGRFAAQTLLETESSIGRLRGKVHRYQGLPLVVSYHPAYLLRNQPDKAKAWQDLLLARKVFLQASS
ncbi:uracil-DNA glycosylase [Chromobacterium violaceum]|uniref:uracil-DNA glycosylase n=1 Tax=Chromobacterium violaceum TaxID=536 RepID=UPI0009DAA009|nr:uracil-DNA glycosylase [Chromobacterium violaceum]OQS48558.1 uracil-DNA glycosylase [Chromobacterium violaceum]OQS52064.1 uracil-DNA glycosylase [Chromobacterium violaceum]QRO32985.1 uracil-DNA glycosylase [Chromobacterium violaceum]QRQ17214.1 uracil-DNA glycosylase [Chromobacterium violaceum]